eukprot:403333990
MKSLYQTFAKELRAQLLQSVPDEFIRNDDLPKPLHDNDTSINLLGEGSKSCFVDDLMRERYDCCSLKSQNTCIAMSVVDFIALLLVCAGFGIALYKSTWLKNQLLIIYMFALFMCTLLVRGLYYSVFGYPDIVIEAFFFMKALPILNFHLALTGFLVYLFYLKNRYEINGQSEEEKATYKKKLHTLFLCIAPAIVLVWGSLLVYCVKQGVMQPLDISVTVIFGTYFIMYLYVPIELYVTLKRSIPPVTVHIKKYLIALMVISEFHIFTRMVFLSVTDIAEVSKVNSMSDNSDNWPGLIIGQALSEILSVAMCIGTIWIVYKIEKVIDAFYIHGKFFKKVKLSDLKESLDQTFGQIKSLQDGLESFDRDLQEQKGELHNVDFDFLPNKLKKQITSFEDDLFEVINQGKHLQARKQDLHNLLNEYNSTLELADHQSIPQMDKLSRELDYLRGKIKSDIEDGVPAIRKSKLDLELEWLSLNEQIREQDALMPEKTRKNHNQLKCQIIPIQAQLEQLDSIYKRIQNNPYLTQSYYSKIRDSLNEGLDSLKTIKIEIIGKYNKNIDKFNAFDIKRANQLIIQGLENLAKIERDQVSLLKDCNILFQQEAKSSSIKQSLQELQINIDHEIENIYKQDQEKFDDNYMKTLINLKVSVQKHEIYQLDTLYNQAVQERKDLDYFNSHDLINKFEQTMMKTLNCEISIAQLQQNYELLKNKISSNLEKLQTHQQLKQLIQDSQDNLLSSGFQQFQQLQSVINDYSQSLPQELTAQITAINQYFYQNYLDYIKQKLLKSAAEVQDVRSINLALILGKVKEVQEMQVLFEKGLNKFQMDISQFQSGIKSKIILARKSIDLQKLQKEIQTLDQDQYKDQIKQYSEFILSTEQIILQDIQIPQADQNQLSYQINFFRDLLNLHQRTTDLQQTFSTLLAQIIDLKSKDDLVSKHQKLYKDLYIQLESELQIIKNIRDKQLEAFYESQNGIKIQEFTEIENLREQVISLQPYSESNFQELKNVNKIVSVKIEKLREVIQMRVKDYLLTISLQKMEAFKSTIKSEDLEYLKSTEFSDQEQNQLKVILNDFLNIIIVKHFKSKISSFE